MDVDNFKRGRRVGRQALAGGQRLICINVGNDVAVMLAIMRARRLWFVLSIIWLAALVIAIPIVIASM